MKVKVQKETALVFPTIGLFWGHSDRNGGYLFSISILLIFIEIEFFFIKYKYNNLQYRLINEIDGNCITPCPNGVGMDKGTGTPNRICSIACQECKFYLGDKGNYIKCSFPKSYPINHKYISFKEKQFKDFMFKICLFFGLRKIAYRKFFRM